MGKVIAWVLANGATILGIAQSIIKNIKELLTGVVNLLSLFMPAETAGNLVAVVRNVLNSIDEVIEKLKSFLLPQA